MNRARSVKPHVEQWDRELFDGIVGWPNDPMARRKPGSDQPRVDTETPRPPVPREAPPVQEAQVRRMMIRKDDVARYGATEGCRRCRMLERGLDEGNREAGHSDECRIRMEAMIRGDPAQRQRLEAADRRRDEYLAREVEKGVDRRVEPEVAQEKPQEEESGRGEKRHAEGDEDQEAAADEEEENEFGLGEAEEEPAAKRARVGSRDGPTREPEETSEAGAEPPPKGHAK